MNVSANAPSATIGAMAEEEEEVEDDGKTVALAKGGETDLARIAGRTSLAREAGEINLMRIACTAMRAFLLCRHRQGGTKTNIKTRGLGASRSRAQSLASWVARRPSLTREVGGISPVRIAHMATQASLLCHLSRGGMKTIIKMKGLGASRSRAQSLASWATLRPCYVLS